MKPRALFLLAAAFILCGGAHAAADPSCRPGLAAREVTFSEVRRMQRTWTAHILVDAARCASTSGRFTINFVRLKENAPDLRFGEPFTWTPGEVEISTEFGADETVLHYSIAAEPCACR